MQRRGSADIGADLTELSHRGLQRFGDTQIESIQNLNIDQIDLSSNAFINTQNSKLTLGNLHKKSFSTIVNNSRRNSPNRL